VDWKTILIELMVAGFFAVACMRAHESAGPNRPPTLGDFFAMPTRLERLRRSRWQWFAMVAFMLVLRLQDQLPVAVELMAAVEFAVFLALPVKATTARTPLKQ
jgi:hypothetical protein